MFIYTVVYFSFRSVDTYPVLSSTRATRLASLMLVESPTRYNILVATDTITIIDTDMLHASALFSRKLHFFLFALIQKHIGYRVCATYRPATRFSTLFSDIPTTLNARLPGQTPEFHIYRKLHDWC
jgi:hypothetical protein